MNDNIKNFLTSKSLLGASLKGNLFRQIVISSIIIDIGFLLSSIVISTCVQLIILQTALLAFYVACLYLGKKCKSTRSQLLLYIFYCLAQNCIFFPLEYMLGGGIDSGFPIVFIFGGVTAIILLDRIIAAIVVIMSSLTFIAVYITEWISPEQVAQYTVLGNKTYIDIAFSSIFIGLASGFLLRSLAKNFESNQMKSQELLKQIEESSTKDPLSGAYNRRYLMDFLDKCIKETDSGELRVFSILMFDIDHFKKINDTYGHLAGDDCIKNLAYTLKRSIRSIDIVSRYGGEEFICVLPSAEETPAFRRAEQIRSTIENSQLSKDVAKKISISGGVAMYKPGMTAEELIKIADENLYIAKENGRNQIVWHNGGIPPLCYVAYDPNEINTVNSGRRFTDVTA